MRRLSRRARLPFVQVRFLLLKGPPLIWNLTFTVEDRLSILVRWKATSVRDYLKEWFRHFWDFPHNALAEAHLSSWARRQAQSTGALRAFGVPGVPVVGGLEDRFTPMGELRMLKHMDEESKKIVISAAASAALDGHRSLQSTDLVLALSSSNVEVGLECIADRMALLHGVPEEEHVFGMPVDIFVYSDPVKRIFAYALEEAQRQGQHLICCVKRGSLDSR
jgi:hypothetical protein